MTYRVAASLLVLRNQINTAWPQRTKGADGTIGDTAHQAEGSASDHNPWMTDDRGIPVVRALDVTHDPAHGCDTYALADRLRLSKPTQIVGGGYIISNRHITSEIHGWEWDDYTGSDPHTGHMHVSVSRTQVRYDMTSPWEGVTEEDEMQLTDKITLVDKPDVKYSSPTTDVAHILASTNYYVLQLRNLMLGTLPAACAAAVVAAMPQGAAGGPSLADVQAAVQATVHAELSKVGVSLTVAP